MRKLPLLSFCLALSLMQATSAFAVSFSKFVPIVSNPISFGFSNSVDAAFNQATGAIARHPDEYVFWDGFHPTTRVHLLAAQFIYQFASRRLGFSVLSSR